MAKCGREPGSYADFEEMDIDMEGHFIHNDIFIFWILLSGFKCSIFSPSSQIQHSIRIPFCCMSNIFFLNKLLGHSEDIHPHLHLQVFFIQKQCSSELYPLLMNTLVFQYLRQPPMSNTVTVDSRHRSSGFVFFSIHGVSQAIIISYTDVVNKQPASLSF